MEEQKKFTAKCEYDLAAYRGYVRDGMPRLHKMRRRILIFMLCVCIVEAIIFSVLFIVEKPREPMMLIAPVMLLLFAAPFACVLFSLPRIFLRREKKLGNRKTDFSFGADSFEAVTVSEKINAHAEIKYSVIESIIEKGNYYYISCGRNNSFIVDRSTVAGGTPEELSAFLREAVGKKRFRGKNK